MSRRDTRTSSCLPVRRSALTTTLLFISSQFVTRPSFPALFEPDGETRHDWEIFFELQTRMEHDGVLGHVKRQFGKQFFGPEGS